MKTARNLFAGIALAAITMSSASATEPEKKDVTIAVGSVIMNYMPVGLADATKAFEKQGLNVTVENFKAGGSKALQALVGGSVEAVVGAYDHTIQMQSKGKSVQCVVQLNTLPGNTLAVRADLADKVKTGADLKGLKIGITTPGSSADMAVRYYLQRNGLKPTDVEIMAVGSGTPGMVALEHGNIDALIYWDPVATILLQKKAVKVLFDARTPEGNTTAFGGPISPFACLYATEDFIQKNPETIQRLVNAFVETLHLIQNKPAAEIVDTLPDTWKLPGQRDLNIAIMEASKPMFSKDGMTIPDSVKINYGIVSAYSDEVKNAKIDLDKTYTNTFAEEAAKRLPR